LCNRRGHSLANNEKGCYPFEQCEPGEMGIPEEPPPPAPECTENDVSKCQGPPEAECGRAICVDGSCKLDIATGPIKSRRAGDCRQKACSSTGVVVEESDPSDYYDDGAECTFDYCKDGVSQNASMDGLHCPNTGEGYCSEGQCMSCLVELGALHCKPGKICDYGLCVPMSCQNGSQDPDETDYDCGGPCAPCFVGDGCMAAKDCRSGVCGPDFTCQAPACDDKVENNGEADVDCGASCPGQLCGDGKGCKNGGDCASGVCWGGSCQAATCFDGVKNADEKNIDCGPSCPTDC
jgi:hypothetical protein